MKLRRTLSLRNRRINNRSLGIKIIKKDVRPAKKLLLTKIFSRDIWKSQNKKIHINRKRDAHAQSRYQS